jgi:hypothetical protein
MRSRLPRCAALWAALAVAPAGAGGDEVSMIRAGLGVYEWNHLPSAAGELTVQYRGGRNSGPLHPVAGAKATNDGVLYVYAGLGVDFNLGERVVLRPTFGPGFYRQGRGKDLGAAMNFRTAVEVALRMRGGRRLGLEVDHVSNAGAGTPNAGEESIVLTLSFPLGKR